MWEIRRYVHIKVVPVRGGNGSPLLAQLMFAILSGVLSTRLLFLETETTERFDQGLIGALGLAALCLLGLRFLTGCHAIGDEEGLSLDDLGHLGFVVVGHVLFVVGEFFFASCVEESWSG